MLEYLIEAVNELNLIAAEIQGTETISSLVNVNLYTISSTAIAPLAVRVNGKYLQKEFIEDLDNEIQWESSSAIRMNILTWCGLGANKFIIAPRPLVNPTSMYVEELIQHPPITDGSMVLSIRPEYEPAIEDYMVHRAMFREGGPELNQIEAFYGRFLTAVQELSGRNVIRRYPSWDVAPETKSSEATMIGNVTPGSKS
jgi:hypothetical protein